MDENTISKKAHDKMIAGIYERHKRELDKHEEQFNEEILTLKCQIANRDTKIELQSKTIAHLSEVLFNISKMGIEK